MRLIVALVLTFLSAAATAAPWCLIKNEREICVFDTSTACYNAVAREGGSCRENYIEVGASGGAKYCVVTAKYKRCQYRSRDRCVRAAIGVNGGCVENIERELELSARRKSDGGGGDCEDLSCELNQASQSAASSAANEQIIIDVGDEETF